MWRGWSIAKPSSKGCWKGCARPSPDGSRPARYESEAQDLREKLSEKKAKLKAAESRIRARISAREAKRKHHVIEQFKNEQLSLWGESAAL